jgi:hypothetical protein
VALSAEIAANTPQAPCIGAAGKSRAFCPARAGGGQAALSAEIAAGNFSQ